MTYLWADLRAAQAVGANTGSVRGRPPIDENHVPAAAPAPKASLLSMLTERMSALDRALPTEAEAA